MRITQKKMNMVCIILLIFLTGCSKSNLEIKTQNKFNQISLFQIYINCEGDLVSPIDKKVVKNEERYINNILNNYYKYKKYYKNLKLMIYIHGGLNNYGDSINRSNNILNLNLEDILKKGEYPVFISWDSSFTDNYLDHISYEKEDSNKKNILSYSISPLILIKDILRGIVEVPKNTFKSVGVIKNDFDTSLYCKKLDKVKKNFNVFGMKNTKEKGYTSNNLLVINPLKIIGGTLADSLGKGTYKSMVNRINSIFYKKNNVISLDYSNHKELYFTQNNETAVSYFFRRYKEIEMSKNQSDKYGNIVLIAHSMGTIVANKIISKFKDLNYETIVYMGGACSMKDIKDIISPYLESNVKSKFYNLSLDPQMEINENMGMDFLPRGSLLIYLDEMYENIGSFLDKTSGIWWNIVIGADQIFPKDIRDRVCLTKFGSSKDKINGPKIHGEFDEFKFWDEKYWKADNSLY